MVFHIGKLYSSFLIAAIEYNNYVQYSNEIILPITTVYEYVDKVLEATNNTRKSRLAPLPFGMSVSVSFANHLLSLTCCLFNWI